MLTKVLQEKDIAPGGMKAAAVNGREIVICSCGGTYYAVERACGHANARLERGALTGWILTCPLHFAQFDIRSGEALSGPAPKAPESAIDPRDPSNATRGLKTYPVKTEGGWILADIP